MRSVRSMVLVACPLQQRFHVRLLVHCVSNVAVPLQRERSSKGAAAVSHRVFDHRRMWLQTVLVTVIPHVKIVEQGC